MTSDLRRSFAVTFAEGEDQGVTDCLRALDVVTARLRTLAEAGKCAFYDTTTEEMEPVRTVTYQVVFGYFKTLDLNINLSKRTANVMQTLFAMRTPVGERAVRFYCTDYHHQPGVCACPALIWPIGAGPKRLRYRPLGSVAIARLWLMDRTDLLALTDEQLAALDIHPNTRQHVIDFIVWLRANPQAR